MHGKNLTSRKEQHPGPFITICLQQSSLEEDERTKAKESDRR